MELVSHEKAMHDALMLRPTAKRPQISDDLDGSAHPQPKPLITKMLEYSITTATIVAREHRRSGIDLRDNSVATTEARTTITSGRIGDIAYCFGPCPAAHPSLRGTEQSIGGKSAVGAFPALFGSYV
jgi:hypothetical protein